MYLSYKVFELSIELNNLRFVVTVGPGVPECIDIFWQTDKMIYYFDVIILKS